MEGEKKGGSGPVWIVVILIIVAAIWGFSRTKQSPNDTTIRVGVIAPLTGPAAVYGVEGKNSVVLALDEINAAGGIGGKKIDYYVEDGKCDAKAALDAWNKLVSINHVTVVFGGHCSTESLAIAPLSARDHVPVFAVFATAPTIPNEGEWFFRHVSTNAYYGVKLAEQAWKRGYRSVAVLTEVKDFPVTYSQAFIEGFKALGGTIALDERFDPQTKDYRTEALKLKGKTYDAIFVSTQAPDAMGLVTNQIRDLKLEKPFMYNHGFSPAKFLEMTRGYMPANALIVEPYADPNSSKIKAFNDDYVAKYGKLYNFNPYFITADYDIVHRFKDAAEACNTNGGYTIDCVRDQFKNATSYSGVAGDVTISSQYSPKGVLTPIGLLKVESNGSQSIVAVQ